MKKNLRSLMAALAAFATVSCAELEQSAPVVQNSGNDVLYATSSLTKTTLKPSADGRRAVLWANGDEIGVAGKNTGGMESVLPAVFTNISAEGESAAATFRGTLPAGRDIVAVYPSALFKVQTAAGSVVTIPSEQQAVLNDFPQNAEGKAINPSYAYREGPVSSGDELVFHNLASLFGVAVPDYLENITEIKIEFKGAVPAGDFTFQADAPAPVLKSSAQPSHTVTLTLPAGAQVFPTYDSKAASRLDAVAASTFYTVVAPGNYTGVTVTLHTATPGSFVRTAELELKMEAGRIMTLDLANVVPAPVPGDYFLYDGTWASASKTESEGMVDGKKVIGYVFSNNDFIKEDRMLTRNSKDVLYSLKSCLENRIGNSSDNYIFHGYVISKDSQNGIWESSAQNYTGSEVQNLNHDSYTYLSYHYANTIFESTGPTPNYEKHYGFSNTGYWKTIPKGGNLNLVTHLLQMECPANTSGWYVPSSGDIIDMKTAFDNYSRQIETERTPSSLYEFILSLYNVENPEYWTSSISRTGTTIWAGQWSLAYNIKEGTMLTGEHRDWSHNILYMLAF